RCYCAIKRKFLSNVNLSSLDTKQQKWFYLNASIPANSAFTSACVGGTNKDIIFLLEHVNPNNTTNNYTVVYENEVKDYV
ncbi:25132_t:CDS:1, partial [Racocetra persica]